MQRIVGFVLNRLKRWNRAEAGDIGRSRRIGADPEAPALKDLVRRGRWQPKAGLAQLMKCVAVVGTGLDVIQEVGLKRIEKVMGGLANVMRAGGGAQVHRCTGARVHGCTSAGARVHRCWCKVRFREPRAECEGTGCKALAACSPKPEA